MKIIKWSKLQYLPASHEEKGNPHVWKKILFEKDDLVNGRIQMINWAKLPKGKTFNAHYHEDMEEVFIILSGKAKIYVDKEVADLERGDAVIIPLGHSHKMSNISDEDVYYITIGISLGKHGKTVRI